MRLGLNRFVRTLEILILIWVIATVLGPNPARSQQSGDEARWLAAEKPLSTAPVAIDGHFLLLVRGVTAYPAAQRAQAIAGRIKDLAADRSQSTDSLHLAETEHSTDIMAGDELIMSVFDADAHLEGAPRRVLAKIYLTRIKTAVEDYRAERNPAQLLRDTVTAFGCTLLLAGILFAIFRTQRWLTRHIESRYHIAIEQIERGTFRLVSAASIWRMVHVASALLSLFTASRPHIYLLSLRSQSLSVDAWLRGQLSYLGTGAPVRRCA